MIAQYRQFRCTRNQPYPQNCPPEERQGYYIHAKTRVDALLEMQRMHPLDTDGFTIDEWLYW